MPDIHLSNIIAKAIRDGFSNLQNTPSTSGDPNRGLFRRVHPQRIFDPAVPTTDLGAMLGCLRFMPRHAPGLRIDCGQAYSLTVDPEQTAPNAQIGVSLQGSSAEQDFVVLKPGDTLECPTGFTWFQCFNADQQDQIFNLVAQPANANLGYCSFLLGNVPGATPHMRHRSLMPLAALIQHGQLGLSNLVTLSAAHILGFSPQGLKSIRVSLYPRTAGGALVVGPGGTTWVSLGLFSFSRAQQIAAQIFPPNTQTINTGPFTNISMGTLAQLRNWGIIGPPAQSSNNTVNFDIPDGAVACEIAYVDLGLGVEIHDLYAFIEGVAK